MGADNSGGDGRQRKRAQAGASFAECRARQFGASLVVYCLADEPAGCAHAVRLKAGTLCLHPERDEFIRRAKCDQHE